MDARRTLLVVDDDDATRLALAEVLEDAGYSVATASSGAEAVEFLGRESVDAMLLDLVMPEMDGWAVAAQIRADPDLVHLPIVVMTAHGAKTLATAPVASGYLSKPIAVDTMLAMLRRTIALRSPAAREQRSSGVRRKDTQGVEATSPRGIPRARDSEPGAMSS